ncbi:MAG TPA: homocysteine S-methyltransferase family protein, partial [Solirubrobacteraceae bacterium]
MILDGGVGTELSHSAEGKDALDEPLWGTRALIESPDAVLRVHREYVQAGCDVISTNTWGLASAVATDGPRLWSDRETPVHWMDVGRRGLRLARQAVHELERDGECAVAFSLNGDVDS